MAFFTYLVENFPGDLAMNDSGEWVYVTVDIVLREREKAILVEIGKKQYWLPKYGISPFDLPLLEEGQMGQQIAILDTVAQEKGLA